MLATVAQTDFINALAKARGIVVDTVGMTKVEASQKIQELKKIPVAPKFTTSLTVGMYRTPNGKIYKVQKSKFSDNLYAKVLTPINGDRENENDKIVHWTFKYEAGAIKFLTLNDKLSLADAKAWGIKYGVCCVCGKTLEDAKSVAAGIGPVCAKNF